MTFSDQSTINAHYDTEHGQSSRKRRSEHGTGIHECNICGKRCFEKRDLKLHQTTVHGIGEVPSFQCDLCSRKFNRKSNLRSHLSTIHQQGDVTDFNCDICDKKFRTNGNCKKHMALAHGVGDFKTFPANIYGR